MAAFIAILFHPKRSLGNTSACFFFLATHFKNQFYLWPEKRAMLTMTHQSHITLPTGETELKRVSATIRGRRNLASLSREQLDIPHLVSTNADIDQALESIRRRRSNAAH